MTVKELIAVLKKMDPSAKVVACEYQGSKHIYEEAAAFEVEAGHQITTWWNGNSSAIPYLDPKSGYTKKSLVVICPKSDAPGD